MARKEDSQQWKSALPAAGLVVLVFVILSITAVVRTDRKPEGLQQASGLTVPFPTTEAEPPARQEQAEIVEVETPGSDQPPSVRERADRDYKRLDGMEARFTSHLMLSCDHENTRRHMEGAGWHDNLYLLPAEYHGQDCFRLCWGVYPTRAAAEAEGAILPYLAREFPDRTPKPFAEIRP
jgi:hypothetical protein